MKLTRMETGALGAAALVAVLTPALLLRSAPPTAEPAAPPPMLALNIPRAPSALFERTLFTSGSTPTEAVPGGAPELIGIAGRIGTDAVALVRGGDGKSRTLAVGESVDGWRLESLAIDAALFARGAERARVPLPAG